MLIYPDPYVNNLERFRKKTWNFGKLWLNPFKVIAKKYNKI